MSWILRRRSTRVLAILWLAVWVVSTGASELHEIVVRHTICPEHGELIELPNPGPRASAGSDADHGPVAVAGTGSHRDDGCLGLPPIPDRPAGAHRVPLVTRACLVTSDPTADPAAPRGPPLAYAPKTSPPTTSG
ncbi:MAG: hypothetical protein ABMB14_11845 [Myxococcota bacterium]